MRMIFNFLIFSFTLLFCVQARAGMSETKVFVHGDGNNYNNAVYDALTNAVSQVSGMVIDSESSLEIAHKFGNDDRKNIEIFNQSLNMNTKTKTNGIVDRYEVISKDCNGGRCEVELNVSVKTYTSPGQNNDNRRRIAVMPFDVVSVKICENRSGENKISNSLVSAISSQLTASRRFMVLDRDAGSSYKMEKSLILSEDTLLEERAKLGQVHGTDYILTGTIQNMTVQEHYRHNPITGGSIGQGISGQLIVDFKVMVFSTRQIKFSSSVSVNVDRTDELSCAEITDRLIKQAAMRAVDMLVDDIFPLTVIRTNPIRESIFLNMGGEKVSKGQRYVVYSLGEELFDPYTGESLGAEEEEIALIEISDVKPKFSTAKIIKGNVAEIKEGQICRRTQK